MLINTMLAITVCVLVYSVLEVFSVPKRLRARLKEIRNAGPLDNRTMEQKSPGFQQECAGQFALREAEWIVTTHIANHHPDAYIRMFKHYRKLGRDRARKAE